MSLWGDGGMHKGRENGDNAEEKRKKRKEYRKKKRGKGVKDPNKWKRGNIKGKERAREEYLYTGVSREGGYGFRSDT